MLPIACATIQKFKDCLGVQDTRSPFTSSRTPPLCRVGHRLIAGLPLCSLKARSQNSKLAQAVCCGLEGWGRGMRSVWSLRQISAADIPV